MPQPVRKQGFSSYNSPKHLLKRPKIAVLIGTIAVEWGYIDECLVSIFERANSDTGVIDEVAKVVFETLSSMQLRIDLITKVLRMRLPQEICEDFEARVAPLLRKRLGERTKVIHGSWRISDDYPDDLIFMEPTGRAVRYTEKDFHEILDRVTELRNTVHRMIVVVGNAPKKAT